MFIGNNQSYLNDLIYKPIQSKLYKHIWLLHEMNVCASCYDTLYLMYNDILLKRNNIFQSLRLSSIKFSVSGGVELKAETCEQ